MPEIKLTSDQLGLISLFQSMSGATVKDCIVDEKGERMIFLVSRGQMGLAIGRKGATIQNIERAVKRAVEVVEWSDDPAEMIKNALDPRFVSEVRITDRLDGTKSAVVVVDPRKKGAVLGRGGKNAEKVRLLAKKYFDILNVQIITSV
ncbi:MAG: NusA-like transcription termination signal-binding factor [Thaumarchaeota archaeon]|nr:NusA-like transcription termination signal-binding factor [Nitrososphaerota archaeon]